MTTRRWIDWSHVIFGVWLIASPWLFAAAGDDKPGAWGSWIIGAGIVSLAFFAMYKPAVWGDTMGVLLGALLLASPWMLGLAAAPAVAMNAVITGVLVICYALWAMRIDITFGGGAAYDANRRRSA